MARYGRSGQAGFGVSRCGRVCKGMAGMARYVEACLGCFRCGFAGEFRRGTSWMLRNGSLWQAWIGLPGKGKF